MFHRAQDLPSISHTVYTILSVYVYVLFQCMRIEKFSFSKKNIIMNIILNLFI